MSLPDSGGLPTVIGGHYEALQLLGAGGMGAVYKARELRTGTTVALKLLRPELGDVRGASRRFEREARAIARLNHPNIVRILDTGHDEAIKTGFLVMEHVQGPSLAAVLATQGPLPAQDLRSLALGLGRALEEAHRLGVIHRDIKPANILLEQDRSGADRVRVCDFGMAKILGERSNGEPTTLEGTVLGTPAYMAPEQARSEPVDGRSDIYSFGVVLFEAASGTRPFEADSPIGYLMKHAMDPPRPVASVAPSLDPTLAEIVDRCLQKAPEQRPQSMGCILEGLDSPPTEDHLVSAEVSLHALATASPVQRAPTPRGLVAAAAFAILGLGAAALSIGVHLGHFPIEAPWERAPIASAHPDAGVVPGPVQAPFPPSESTAGVTKAVALDESLARARPQPAQKARARRRPTSSDRRRPTRKRRAPPRARSRTGAVENSAPPTPTQPALSPKPMQSSGKAAASPPEPTTDSTAPLSPSRHVRPQPQPAPPPPTQAELQPINISVEGGVSRAKVKAAIKARWPRLQSCLKGASRSEITATIGFAGRLKNIAVQGGASGAGTCVAAELRMLRMPRPDTGHAQLRLIAERPAPADRRTP